MYKYTSGLNSKYTTENTNVHCVNKLFLAFIKKKVSVFIKTSSCTLLHGIKKNPTTNKFFKCIVP